MSAEFRLKLPKKLTTGPADLIREWNQMVDSLAVLERAVKARTLRPTPGTKVQVSADGSRVSLTNASRTPRPFPPLWVHFSYDAVAVAWKYSLTPGYLIYQQIGTAEKLDFHTPTLGGTSLEAATPPTAALPANDCYIYMRVQTDAKGVPSGAPTIVHSTTEETSTHHVPPHPDEVSGIAGDYYFLLAEFEDDGATPGKPQPVRRLTGNKQLPNQLIELENVGGAVEIYRQYLDGADDKHELRTLNERASSPQINVKYENEGSGDPIDAESIIIEGNGYANSGGGFATVQSVDDGLVTGFTDFSFGHDGNVVVPDPCGLGYYTLVFEKGNLRSAAFTTL